MGSVVLPHLVTAWHVDQAIMSEEERLVVIRFGDMDQDYGPALAEAVNDATTIKPDVAFDVLTPVPTTATPEVQDHFTRQGIADAQDVANALVMDGVSPDQVHMGFRADAGTPPREVLVFAR